MSGIDLSALPTGQLSWAALVDYVVASDDRVERYFLEVKSAVDLNTSSGRSKVAKFILGAANRDPARAAPRFSGRAVMLLGVSSGRAHGIEPFEAMELARFVGRLIGADGPRWDYERIPVADGRDVIAVHVAPPTGDIWTCRADAEGLRDGAVYVRADGETREAKGDELRLMLDRLKSRAPDIDIAVEVEGKVRNMLVDTEFLGDAVDTEARRLRELAAPPSTTPYGVRFPALAGFTRDYRGRDSYLEEVERWREQAVTDPLGGARELAGYVHDGIQIRVVNNTSRYLRGVRIELAFDDRVEALCWNDPDDERYASAFPDAPRAWGTDSLALLRAPISLSTPASPRSRHGIARVVTMSPALLVMELDDLRPKQTFLSDADDVVLAIFGEERLVQPIGGTWTMTAEDVHEIFTDEFETPVDTSDWRDRLAVWLGSDSGQDVDE